MKTNSFFKVQSSSYMNTCFLIVSIKDYKEVLTDCILPKMISNDGKFYIIIIGSIDYNQMTGFLKRQKIQLSVSSVDFFAEIIYSIIPQDFFDIADNEEYQPSELEIGCPYDF